MKHAYLDLNKMGLTPMSEAELFSIDGGNFWKWLGAVAGIVAAGLLP